MAFTQQQTQHQNVGEVERFTSLVGGGALLLYGMGRRSLSGLGLAVLGGGLLYRGVTGHCQLYASLGLNTAEGGTQPPYKRAIKVTKSVTVQASPEEVYRFWRSFDNLPRFMRHLESVQTLDDHRSRWTVSAPMGQTIAWDAEIINEVENELIAWQSLENADVYNSGSVHFRPAIGGRGTEVNVVIRYTPPAGALGVAVAKLFGEEPGQQLDDDLRRFKQLMEAREIPTTTGQPSGREALSAGA